MTTLLKPESDQDIPITTTSLADWMLDIRALCEKYRSDPHKGLSQNEVESRLRQVGFNQLPHPPSTSVLALLRSQFQNWMTAVLVIAVMVSGFLGDVTDMVVIGVVILLNGGIGFFQEYKAEQALAALRQFVQQNTRVLRDGNKQTIDSTRLVPGDIVELEAGDRVPADGRLIDLTHFTVQEAALTGESVPVTKSTHAINSPSLPLADRHNMVYMGTSVVSGKARVLITLTGLKTELGHIANMLESVHEDPTPLQDQLKDVGHRLIGLCLIVVCVVAGLQFWRGARWGDVFLGSVSLAVAAIPEGLPAVVTIALALGVQRMVKRRALIRHLPAVETLGSTTVICTDKTGTLTQNEMVVRKIWVDGHFYELGGSGYQPNGEVSHQGQPVPFVPDVLKRVLEIGTRCNAASLHLEENKWHVVGDPTEAALLVAAKKAGLPDEIEALENRWEIPFDSKRKRMTVIYQVSQDLWRADMKGAADVVLPLCQLPPDVLKNTLKISENLAGEGYRVLAMASRTWKDSPKTLATDQIETAFDFAGFQAIVDPPRIEVKAAIESCHQAGIRTVMITGDHPQTAAYIGQQVGLSDAKTHVVTGAELDALNTDEQLAVIQNASIFARVTPEHKLRIVQVLRNSGEVVAMTGDGVNDAPALKASDIGIAMGIAGTDVTKQAADMVILDDHFETIVAAVEEGRTIYQNIRKSIFYLLSGNAGEIFTMLGASLIGLPIPLLPLHILWLNLVTDSFPAVALSMEKSEPGYMRQKPRIKGASMMPKAFWFDILGLGFLIGLCSLVAFVYSLWHHQTIEASRGAALMTLIGAHLINALNCRSEKESIFHQGAWSNPFLIRSVCYGLAIQWGLMYWAPSAALFRVALPTGTTLMLAVCLSLTPLIVVEGFKFLRSTRNQKDNTL